METKQDNLMRKALNGLVERVVAYGWRTDEQRESAVAVLTGVNRLAGLLGQGRRGRADATAQMHELVGLVTDLAGARRGRQQFLVDALAALNDLAAIAGLRDPVVAHTAKAPARATTHRRADFKVTYVVRKGRGNQERLVEQREGSRKSLSATKKDYAAAIKAFADFDAPAKFEKLWERFVAHGGGEIGSKYPLRVVLRFWRSATPPLITKTRARYAPASGPLAKWARAVWKDAKPSQ